MKGGVGSRQKNHFWSLQILMLSVASIRRKLLKRTYTEEQSVHMKSESFYIRLESQKNPFNVLNFKHIIYILQSIVVYYFFNTFINSWYLIIFFKFLLHMFALHTLNDYHVAETPSRNKIIISALYVIKIKKNIRRKCIFWSVNFWSSKLIKWQCFQYLK